MRVLMAVAAATEACTSMAFTRSATQTDSSFVTHTNDCVECDARVAHIPARVYQPGARRAVYKSYFAYPREVGTGRAGLYELAENPELVGQPQSVPLGYVPQVEKTHGYFEASYPYMNEKGLAFGESTAAATLWTLEPDDGSDTFPDRHIHYPTDAPLFGIIQLMQIALERCATARCAIQLMGDLANTYGFWGEDPATGEALSVTDNNETWVFNVGTADWSANGTFPGPLAGSGFRSFWAAQRVPEGHVAVVPNAFTIREIDPEDKENFMFPEELFSKAQEAGLWDGKGAMDFALTWGPDPVTHEYFAGVPPVPRYSSMRSWRVYDRVAPSLGLQPTVSVLDLPFSVPVDQKLTKEDIFDLQRDHYEGTAYDMRMGILAGPFGNPNRLEGGIGMRQHEGEYPRAISIPRTTYAMVAESLPPARKATVGSAGIMWFAADAPATSVFVPFYTNNSPSPTSPYQQGNRYQFTRGGAWWAFNFVANFMQINYANMSTVVIPAMTDLQTYVGEQAAAAERGGAWAVANMQEEVQGKVVAKWWDVADDLVVRYNDGFMNTCSGVPNAGERNAKKCRTATAIGYNKAWLDMIGFNFDIRPQSVLPGSPMALTSLPTSPAQAPWLVLATEPRPQWNAFLAGETAASNVPWTMMAAVVAAGLMGFWAGRATSGSGAEYHRLD